LLPHNHRQPPNNHLKQKQIKIKNENPITASCLLPNLKRKEKKKNQTPSINPKSSRQSPLLPQSRLQSPLSLLFF
jgi:hypothetical protein